MLPLSSGPISPSNLRIPFLASTSQTRMVLSIDAVMMDLPSGRNKQAVNR